MRQALHRGLSGACGGGRSVGAESHVNNELAEVGGFLEGDKRGFRKEVLSRWIRGEDMETFPEDMFEMVNARIVAGGESERQVMGSRGGAGAVGVVKTME